MEKQNEREAENQKKDEKTLVIGDTQNFVKRAMKEYDEKQL